MTRYRCYDRQAESLVLAAGEDGRHYPQRARSAVASLSDGWRDETRCLIFAGLRPMNPDRPKWSASVPSAIIAREPKGAGVKPAFQGATRGGDW
jgi:hypothetical protein